jgi:hypothetical protein
VPLDYVTIPLIAAASALIGNARWACAWGNWDETPVLWRGCVGEPSSGKSNGASMVTNLLDAIEAKIGICYDDELLDWKDKKTLALQHEKLWKKAIGAALVDGGAAPQKPGAANVPKRPIRPRLTVTDTTIEQLATILSGNPKGLLVRRDELSGWFANFSRYNNGSDRPFWLEANGSRSYQVDRVRSEEPTLTRHLSLAVFGTIQPDRLADTLTGADDGFMSRFLWTRPEPKCFAMPDKELPQEDAIAALLRLQCIQEREKSESGLMKSTLGKARGQALRLALVLEYLW